MDLKKLIEENICNYIFSNYELKVSHVEIQSTRKEYKGDITVVIFPLIKLLKKSPLDLGSEIGDHLLSEIKLIENYNVIHGFLNLNISNNYYIQLLKKVISQKKFGISEPNEDSPLYLVEFSSPNTNKPLHLGHIRNILLGSAISNILEANGKKVVRTQIINDRGIHICKSIVAWQNFAKNDTPEITHTKGDHFVGKYYVLFEKIYREQVSDLMKDGYDKKYAEKNASIFQDAQNLLLKWESGDKEVIKLWKKMNNWVYRGFQQTYSELNVHFDSNYYESKTYLTGKKVVEKGVADKIFSKKSDGS